MTDQPVPQDDVTVKDDVELLSVVLQNASHPLSRALLTHAQQALERLRVKALQAEQASGSELMPISRGRFVRVIRGKKLPHGSLWCVEWKGPTEHGYSIGLRSLYGEFAFTAYKNVLGAAPRPDEEAHFHFMLELVRQHHSVPIISPLPNDALFHAYVSCRFCRKEVSTMTSGWYQHLRGCKEIPRTLLPAGMRYVRRS